MLYLVSIEGFLFFFSFLISLFFCWSLFKLVLKVSEASRTDSGCIGLQVTLKDWLLHSMAGKKKENNKTLVPRVQYFGNKGSKCN